MGREKNVYLSQESKISCDYSKSQEDETTKILNPHCLCYWLDLSGGHPELNQCDYRKDEFHDKLGWMGTAYIFSLASPTPRSRPTLGLKSTACSFESWFKLPLKKSSFSCRRYASVISWCVDLIPIQSDGSFYFSENRIYASRCPKIYISKR